MPEQSLDSRGRVTIEKGLRQHLGKRFVQVLTPRGIFLRALTGKIDWKDSPPDLAMNASRIAREEMDKEIEEELWTIHGVSLDGKRRRKPARRVRKAR